MDDFDAITSHENGDFYNGVPEDEEETTFVPIQIEPGELCTCGYPLLGRVVCPKCGRNKNTRGHTHMTVTTLDPAQLRIGMWLIGEGMDKPIQVESFRVGRDKHGPYLAVTHREGERFIREGDKIGVLE